MSEPVGPSHTESIHIAAPRERVWELVTAMERYGEWSSENTGGYWRKGADGEPGTGRVGDQFVGINRRDGTEWKAPVEIVERDEERAYGFVTGGTEMNLALWRYELEDDADGGTLLTEDVGAAQPRLLPGHGRRGGAGAAGRQRRGEHRRDAARHEGDRRGRVSPGARPPSCTTPSPASGEAEPGSTNSAMRPRCQRWRARRTMSATCGVSGGGSTRGSTPCRSIVKASPSSPQRSSAPT